MEALVRDSRRSINRIEEAVTDLSAIRSASFPGATGRYGNTTEGAALTLTFRCRKTDQVGLIHDLDAEWREACR